MPTGNVVGSSATGLSVSGNPRGLGATGLSAVMFGSDDSAPGVVVMSGADLISGCDKKRFITFSVSHGSLSSGDSSSNASS